jgi:hypothetical protein
MKRLCFLCGKKIGFVRTFWDQQYCSDVHRREARLASSQALREEDDAELWTVTRSKSRTRIAGRTGPTTGQTASAFAFLTVVGLLVVALLLPGPGSGGKGAPSLGTVSMDPSNKRGMMDRASDFVSDMVRQKAPVTLHHDFRAGLSDWSEHALRGVPKVDDPHTIASATPETIRPGSLRLWDRSTSLQNYQMEFLGQMDKKSLSWAFRALDENNFYATKIVITKPGPLPNAGLVHYVMMNGREWDRVVLPLPVTLERGVNYRIRMSVQDERFVTYLNGQVISSWSDKRLHHGGVGFFSEEDDSQKVSWVSLSERDSLLGRMLSHFSLIVVPGSIR